ncbi:MAG: glycosyltransferase [Bacteroidota bacterium]|nr:glycosyltransferase [Bacteroidota bacterium]
MVLLITGITALLALITLTVLVNMTAGPFLRRMRSTQVSLPSVAVLIPARNEERNIGTLLALLRTQDYSPFTVTVLDDHSTDATAGIVAAHTVDDARIRLKKGAELPAGWTGKNWACHQLADGADADILLFVDADVQPSTHALRDTVAGLRQYGAGALSTFPLQLLRGTAAAMITPVMDVILYGFLPLPLVWRTKTASLAAANGQWFAFTREAYRAVGGHAAVRGEIVEDIALARRIKSIGLRMLLTVGAGSVACRMYTDRKEILEGFSKNFFAAFSFRLTVFFTVLLLLLLVFVFPYVLLLTTWWKVALPAVALNTGLRLLLTLRAGHRWLSTILHPLGILGAVGIGLDAIRRYRRGAVQWKGRDITVRPVK